MHFYELVALSVKQNASDLHLSAGSLPVFRIDGQLHCYGEETVESEKLSAWLAELLSTEQWQTLQAAGELDCALDFPQVGRVRGNMFRQRQGLSVAFRHLSSEIPSLSALLVPPVVESWLTHSHGLLLVVGATGSGKSTTLAAMVQALNQRSRRHVITLEQPIEFLHRSQQCLIQQREIGQHCHSFPNALRAALREDPDILLLGELRDTQTIRLALTAAETGHLILASLHSRSAIQSVDRLVDVFPTEEKAFVRTLLAGSLRGVIAQQLLPRKEGGRVAVFEVLTGTPALSHMIREGKTHQLLNLLQTGRDQGMQTFEQGIQQRRSEGLLSEG